MHALTYEAYGSSSVLSLQEIDPPAIGDSDVLVRVHAASVNSWDRDNLQGSFPTRAMLGWFKPKIRVAGGDIAGRVHSVGSAVTRWKVGDEVLCDLSNSGWGAFAEYARAPEQILAPKPAALSFAAAAALPQAAVIALQGIRDHGQVQAGQRVLINGAGGGVGSFAVQLAKSQGAEVTGVDSEAKLARLSTLGADHVIDYRAQDYTESEQRYDFILDCELHRSPLACRRVLTPNGRLTVVGGALPRILQTFIIGSFLAKRAGQKLDVLMHQPNKDLGYLAQLVADGGMRSAIEREYTLAEAPLALQRMCDGEVIGKAVIVMP
jgi:NADPH:quinone reductase-like Zn-dependent oxidoreductase